MLAASWELFSEALKAILQTESYITKGKNPLLVSTFSSLVEGLIVAWYVLCKSCYFVKENAIDF